MLYYLGMSEEIDNILKYGRELGFPLIKDDSVRVLIESVKKYNPKRILEIGTAIGYSGAQMLNVCDANLITLEKNSDSANIALQNFKNLNLQNRVQVINCDAKDYIEKCTEKFDFIFLDGPKAQYLHYKEKLIDLLNVGGVLFADNVLFRGYVKGGKEFPHRLKTIVVNLRQFLDEIVNDNRLKTEIIDVGDGVSISVKISD